MELPKSRKGAQQEGSYYYFTGKPCKRGNTDKRRVYDGMCQCELCRATKSKQSAAYANAPENREKVLRWKREEKQRNKERYKARAKEYYLEQGEYIRAKALEYARNNPEMVNKRNKERRLKMKEFTPSWFEDERDQIKEIYNIARQLEELTGDRFHVDHMYPIAGENVCGLHCAANLQPIPAKLNHEKGNREQYTEYMDWLVDYEKPLYSSVSV